MLKQIVSAKNEQVKIVAQFREWRANIETSGIKNQSKLLGIMLGIMVVLFYLMIAWATGQLPIDFFLAVICAGSASVTGAIRRNSESITGAVRENTDVVRDICGMLRK